MATLGVALSFKAGAQGNGSLAVIFDHYVGGQPLQFDSVSYRNELGQTYIITKFKYYIGDIRLKKMNGEGIVVPGYYLVNEEEQESKRLVLEKIPFGVYQGIEFIVGVDSLHNCSGAQSGALDPIRGMFWTWNTGYIFLKLEGKSPASQSPGNLFEYHIGGYKQPTNCIRTVSLNFSKPVALQKLKALRIKVDASKVLEGSTRVDFAKLSSVTDFHNATSIADNYMNMFSISIIE